MKRVYLVCALLLASLCLLSCNPRARKLERVLLERLSHPASYKRIVFSPIKIVTIAGETCERKSHFRHLLEIEQVALRADSVSLEYYSSFGNGWYSNEVKYYAGEVSLRRDRIEALCKIISHLDSIDRSIQRDSVTFIEYRLVYQADSSFGEFFGRFNTKGELVGVRTAQQTQWTALGEIYSIPKYYELIEQIK